MRALKTPGRPAAVARLSGAPLPSLADVTAPWPGRCVDLGGVDLFVRRTPAERADLPPALFVHGLGGSSQNWTDLAGLLRGQLDIEAIDLPGFGHSGPSRDRDYTIDAQVRAVIAYLEQSGRGAVHLVGNSMGGAITIHVAARRPDLVRSLTLISPAVPDVSRWRVHPLRHDPLMALVVVPWLGSAAVRKLGQVSAQRRAAAMLALCFADPSRLGPHRRAEAIAEIEERSGMPWANEALLRATRGVARSQLLNWRAGWAAMRQIKVPALVVWGDRDKLVAPDLAAHVAAEIPDSRLLVLENVGHVAMMEVPEPTARAMLGLIEDAPQRPCAAPPR